MNFADEITRARPHVESVAAATVNIAIEVEFDSVGDAYVASGEHPSVGQEAAAVAFDYVEGVDGVGIAMIWGLQMYDSQYTYH